MAYKDAEKQREFQRLWMQARRAEAIAYLGGVCVRCGATNDLEMHHRDREEKVSHRILSWSAERRVAELDKCSLLCVPCHRQETVEQFGHRIYLHGTTLMYRKCRCRCRLCKDAKALEQRVYRNARKRYKAASSDAGAEPASSTNNLYGAVIVSTGMVAL